MCYNVKSSTFYFDMKTKILADFKICISVPLILIHFALIGLIFRLVTVKV